MFNKKRKSFIIKVVAITMPSTLKPLFEDCYTQIKIEIEKRRHKWTLTSIAWMDYDDVAAVIMAHVWKKWDKWDHARPLNPWLSKVIGHQISNLIRNNYSSYSRPCLRCEYNEGDEGCSMYGTQCDKCPLFAKWTKSKRNALNIKLPLSSTAHEQEISQMPQENLKIESAELQIRQKMKEQLLDSEWKIYELMFVKDYTDEQIAKELGYKTTEKNRSAGYRTIYLVKKKILTLAKKMIRNEEIDY